jgi:hypothetical protein
LRLSLGTAATPFDLSQSQAAMKFVQLCTARAFVFRCQNTGQQVQGFSDNDEGEIDRERRYAVVECLACGQIHIINPETGLSMSEENPLRQKSPNVAVGSMLSKKSSLLRESAIIEFDLRTH